MILEEKIIAIIKLLQSGNVVWLQMSQYQPPVEVDQWLIDRLLHFIEDGKEKGFSTFFTYKKSLEIIKLVEQDFALALLSPNKFIRLLAETLKNRRNNDTQTTVKST